MLAASYAGEIEKIQILFEEGKRPDISDNHGWTPLHHSVFKDHIDCVKYFLSPIFVDYNLTRLKTHEGETSLFLACGRKTANIDILKLLIQVDPDSVNIPNNESETPLHHACNSQKSQYVELLVNSGADLNSQDYAGDTAIHIASMNGDHKSLEILLYAGADTSITNERGYTALHLSIMNKFYNCTDHLLDFTCNEDINIQNKHGTTALMIAAQHDNERIVEKLLGRGADPHISDVYERLPFQFTNSALEPLIKAMNSNVILNLNFSKFKLGDSEKRDIKLCELHPEIFTLFAIDYLWNSWKTNKSHCCLIIQILLSQISLNYDFEYNYVPSFYIHDPAEFTKLLDIAESLAKYGQEISILWRNLQLANMHSIHVCIELPPEVWALRALSCVNPHYSPYVILKSMGLASNLLLNLQLPLSWEIEIEENSVIQKLPSLKHLSRCAVRKLFCEFGITSYNTFQQKLQKLNLPLCLILYIQYMEGCDK